MGWCRKSSRVESPHFLEAVHGEAFGRWVRLDLWLFAGVAELTLALFHSARSVPWKFLDTLPRKLRDGMDLAHRPARSTLCVASNALNSSCMFLRLIFVIRRLTSFV